MNLPISEALPALAEALRGGNQAVLVAPPGSGKTTVVPLWLMDSGLVTGGEIIVLQPRRVAARSVAQYLAESRGEKPGETIGYQVRFDSKVSVRTRVRIVTEGILTAWLQRDPSLQGVGAVILDEFHERSVHADLGLALLKEVSEALREDLKLIVMSATLAAEPVAAFLGGAPIIRTEGRSFPVDLSFSPVTAPRFGSLASAVVKQTCEVVVAEASRGDAGDILVFMPGAREIEDTIGGIAERVAALGYVCLPLHGRLPPDAQDRAVRPAAGGRPRVVVATNVAETSLTIPGIRTVVDAGLARVSRYDPAVGSTRLELERISRASAAQRAGRAGRLGPGRAIRMWSEHDDQRLKAFDDPEIHRADPASICLELRQWGVADPRAFDFFEAPSRAAFEDADARLAVLGLVNHEGLTALGRAVARLPLDPRASVTLVHARKLRDLSRVALLLASVADGTATGDLTTMDLQRLPGRTQQAGRQLESLAKGIRIEGFQKPDLAGAFVAGFADRVAARRGPDLWQMTGGRRLTLGAHGDLAVVVDIDGGRRGAGSTSRARAWLSIDETALAQSPHYDEIRTVIWDDQQKRAVGTKRRVFRDLVIDDRPEPLRDRALAAELVATEARRDVAGLASRLGERHVGTLARLHTLARLFPDLNLPTEASAWVERLILPLCQNLSSMQALYDEIDGRFRGALDSELSYEVRSRLAKELPESITIPSGRSVTLGWVDGEAPILAAKVQELFGWSEGPRLAGGRLACVIHLLDPGGKPLQVTQDLANFWKETWKSVRSEMRSRYPKHHWPEDPHGEVASQRTTARAFRARAEKG